MPAAAGCALQTCLAPASQNLTHLTILESPHPTLGLGSVRQDRGEQDGWRPVTLLARGVLDV
jgi:hypothetical protein